MQEAKEAGAGMVQFNAKALSESLWYPVFTRFIHMAVGIEKIPTTLAGEAEVPGHIIRYSTEQAWPVGDHVATPGGPGEPSGAENGI